jgi:hypothetical protein
MIGFTLLIVAAMLVVGYMWVRAQEERQSLTIYATDLPSS